VSSIVLGFAYATLLATALLFLMHILEGFNEA
jgi:hypothetical protein